MKLLQWLSRLFAGRERVHAYTRRPPHASMPVRTVRVRPYTRRRP